MGTKTTSLFWSLILNMFSLYLYALVNLTFITKTNVFYHYQVGYDKSILISSILIKLLIFFLSIKYFLLGILDVPGFDCYKISQYGGWPLSLRKPQGNRPSTVRGVRTEALAAHTLCCGRASRFCVLLPTVYSNIIKSLPTPRKRKQRRRSCQRRLGSWTEVSRRKFKKSEEW